MSGIDSNCRLRRHAEGAPNLVNPWGAIISANLFSKAKVALARAFSPAFSFAAAVA